MRIGAVLLTALSQPFLSAPFNWWPWHWFAWVPFLWAIHQQGGRGRLWLAALGGTAANLMIFYWIVNMIPKFTKLPLSVAIGLNLLLCLALSLLWVILAWLLPRLKAVQPHIWTLAAPALLVTLEYATPQLFPYMQGVSHYQVTPLFLLASITGVYGISYLVFWSNCVLYAWWEHRKQRLPFPRWQWLSLLCVVALTLLYGTHRIHQYNRALPHARHLKIALIQSNFRPNDHNDYKLPTPFQIYVKLSQKAAQRGAQWIVWSEGEYKGYFSTPYARKQLLRAAKKVGRPLLLGGFDQIRRGKHIDYTNSAIHVHPIHGYGKRHDKVILVPFGEYFPFEKELDFIYKHIGWRSRFTPGKQMVVDQLDGIPYGFLICYEAIYPSLVRASVRRGAKLLINITYDAWFGRTTAPYQHLMLAAIRSAELGVPLVRLATTGVSTTIDALGRMGKLSPLFQRRILLYHLPLVTLPSFYARYGDLFVFLCATFFGLSLLLGLAKQRLLSDTESL